MDRSAGGPDLGEEVLEERELSLEDYLALFEDGADFALLKDRSARLERIIVKKIKDARGRIFEDTTFVEKTGVRYTVRATLPGAGAQ